MADGEQDVDETVITFDILSASDDLNDAEINDSITQQDIEHVEQIVQALAVIYVQENDGKTEAPPLPPKKSRFAECTDEDLDDLASESVATTTNYQTKWAVKCFKGK